MLIPLQGRKTTRVGGKRRDIPFSGEKPLDWHSCVTTEKPSGTTPWQTLPEPQQLTQALEMYALILSHLHLYQSEIFSGKAARNSWDSNFSHSSWPFLMYSFPQAHQGTCARLAKSIPSEACQTAEMHCGVPFLCNIKVFKESLQRKDGKKINHSWPLQYFYHCLPEEEAMVVWCTRCTGPSSSAGTTSGTHNSRQACQGEPSHGRSWAVIGKKPWVRNTTNTSLKQSFSCFPWGETSASDLGGIKKAASNSPISKEKGWLIFFLNIKKLGFGLKVNFRTTVKLWDHWTNSIWHPSL